MNTRQTGSNRHSGLATAAALILSVVGSGWYVGHADATSQDAASALPASASEPHVLHTAIADVIVRIRGGTVCTGTPITGTKWVVTAAHCVLNRDGTVVHSRMVLRGDTIYTPVAVIVDRHYHDHPSPVDDAAVLVMDKVIPGPSADLGDVFPTEGSITVAGFQPLDSDGTLLRGTRYDSPLRPKGSTGPFVKIETAAAGCESPVSSARISLDRVKLACGLIPGASGGGVFADRNGRHVLVGIISTVATDLSNNGIVPLAAVHQVLDHAAAHTYQLNW